MKLLTRVEQGQTEQRSCTSSGWLLSGIPLKTEGGLLLARTRHLVSFFMI
jgi:hypothetical protein